jgi:broad-specificity NMP kinase
VILIYGRPGSGKTWICKELFEHLNCDWVSVDHKRRHSATAEAAQAKLIHLARSMRGQDLIIECCSPHPRLVDEATLVVEVQAPDYLVRRRLYARRWSRDHIGRALAERYDVDPDLIVVPENPDPVGTIERAYTNKRSIAGTATT